MKHTKLPWVADEKYNVDLDGVFIRGEGCRVGSTGYLGGTEQAKTNAAFIVKAVNNFDRLLEAFKELHSAASWIDDTTQFDDALVKAREAIKNAEAE